VCREFQFQQMINHIGRKKKTQMHNTNPPLLSFEEMMMSKPKSSPSFLWRDDDEQTQILPFFPLNRWWWASPNPPLFSFEEMMMSKPKSCPSFLWRDDDEQTQILPFFPLKRWWWANPNLPLLSFEEMMMSKHQSFPSFLWRNDDEQTRRFGVADTKDMTFVSLICKSKRTDPPTPS